MRKIKLIWMICTIVASCCIIFVSCTKNDHRHEYVENSETRATCTQDGSVTYKCDKCGEEYIETIEATGHTPGPEATTTSPQVCLVCGAVLHEKLPLAPVISAAPLAVNYYSGVSTSFCTTRIDTQVHSKYTLPTQQYYGDPNQIKPINLDISIPIQEFYSHDVLSVYGLATQDGKTFTTPNGFKVQFDIDMIESKPVSDLFAAANGDFYDNFEVPEALKIVQAYQSSDYFGGIFEVVDFANSYIEIEKDGDSANAKKIALWDWERETVRTDIEVSDENGTLFYEEGTYRILFRYSMAWVTNPTSVVYDEDGNACYPYGLINDQYDYFYVTITDEEDGILVPDDYGTDEELFYQLRVDTNIENGGKLFLTPGETICFRDEVDFYVEQILYKYGVRYYFGGKRLEAFFVELYYNDYDSDTGLEGSNPYIFYDKVDLIPLLSEEGIFQISFEKDLKLRDRPCKIVVASKFFDERTEQFTTMQQIYLFTFDWE